jgi:TM2 domain-containing membrane protein YozV
MPPRADVPPPGYVPPPVAPTGTGHPGFAAILGFIPGVGAMYNGQFVKGFIHVLVFITTIWLTNHVEGIFGLLIAGWEFYMVFDAYQTAKAIKFGLPLPDPFGINNLTGGPVREAAYAQRMTEAGERIGEGFSQAASAFQRPAAYPGDPAQAQYAPPPPAAVPPPRDNTPTGAIILIVLGGLFLLGNIGIHLHLDRWWPMLLIGLGVWLFVRRQQRME